VTSAAFSSDGKSIVSATDGSTDDTVRVWNASTGEIEDTVKKTFSFRRRRRLLMVSSDVREPISPARLGALLGGAYLETSNSTLDGYQEYAPADGRTIESACIQRR
jgi:hypothetical protein